MKSGETVLSIIFTKERLILCEGSSDKTFFCELIKKRGLPDCQIQYPHAANETTGGIDKFGNFLLGNINEEFLSVVKGVLVVADNDNDPAKNFDKVVAQIQIAGYGVPDKELEFVKSPGDFPPIAVMMLPLNQQLGNLETVCKVAAYDKWNGLVPTLEDYLNASDVPKWSVGHQDKMRIQCLIAATCEANPYSTISTLYRENAQYHIPLDHPCFNDIAQFITDWDSLLPK